MTKISEETQMAILAKDIEYVKKGVDQLRQDFRDWKKNFVTQDQFKPVKALVYGFTSLILISVIGAVIALVVF
ncbi:MAG: hypothetical protein GY861_03290 [bacterium]|nr:hypothetical protein [bacterium]